MGGEGEVYRLMGIKSTDGFTMTITVGSGKDYYVAKAKIAAGDYSADILLSEPCPYSFADLIKE